MNREHKRLIRVCSGYDTSRLTDLYAITMANIEDAMIETGAKPEVDYTRADLLKAAGPIVKSMFELESYEAICLTTSYPT